VKPPRPSVSEDVVVRLQPAAGAAGEYDVGAQMSADSDRFGLEGEHKPKGAKPCHTQTSLR